LCLVKVGCCGFPRSRRKYYEVFKLVEVQQTFYKLPSLETLEKWRREAPQDFEFTMKAWQVVTHPPTSPTWRKAGLKPEPGKEDRYGNLRPTPENLEAWRRTVEAAEALGATVIVVQTPPSFGYSEENLENAIRFFREAGKAWSGLIAWEPRGTWHEHPEAVARVVEETGVIHAVDLLRRWPAVVGKVSYIRLHGLGGREVNYRYRYTDEDLAELAKRVRSLCEKGSETVYVLFNNIYMFDDAQRFKTIAGKEGLEVV